MRENIFARLTQSIAFVTVGSLFILSSDITFSGAAIVLGASFVLIGFLVAITAAYQLVPRWINRIETVASLALYVSAAGALIKVGIVDGIDGNAALLIILFVYIIMLPAIQAVRILKA
jgi:hypothetical protein